MEELRRRTREAHDRVERLPLFSAILRPGFSLADYTRLLIHLRGFYAVVEPALFDGLPVEAMPALSHRRKTTLLERDIEALAGGGAVSHRLHGLDASDWTAARRMGGLYVLEGATLGGQLIRKQLRRRFGSEIDGALAFYGCYEGRVAAEWGAFRALMGDLFDGKPDEIEDVVSGALAVFACLERWTERQQCCGYA